MSFVSKWVIATKRALSGWDPAKHPRGRDGRFIEVGDLVAVFTGPDSGQIDTGRVIAGHYADDGRMFVAVQSGATNNIKWYRPKQIEQVKPKAVLTPNMPIPDVGSMDKGVPWSLDEAQNAVKAEKMTLDAIEGAGSLPDKYTIMTNVSGSKLAPGFEDDPSYAGSKAAAEVAKKVHGAAIMEGTGADTWQIPSWDNDHKVPTGLGSGTGSALKQPVQVTDGELWMEAWNTLEETAGGPKAAGFGFGPNGVDLEVFDVSDAYNAADEAGAEGLKAALDAQFKVDWPGKTAPWAKSDEAPPSGVTMSIADIPSGGPDISTSAPGTPLEDLKDWEKEILAQLPDQPQAPAPAVGGDPHPDVKLPAGKTASDVLMNIVTSAINKFGGGTLQTDAVHEHMKAAVATDDHKTAHKQLAAAMTIAKLGGKQRARYKKILDKHLWAKGAPVPQFAPDKPVAPAPAPKPWLAKSGSADMGVATPSRPKGFTAKQALNFTEAKKYVTANGTVTNAGAAKGTIQSQITDRTMHVPTADFALVISGSPGFQQYLPDGDALISAWKAGSTPDGMLYKSSGEWRVTKTWDHAGIPATKEALDRAVRETAVNALIRTWATTSNDNNVRSVVMQEAAAEEFGLDPDWIFNWAMKPDKIAEHRAAHMATYREFLRAMYNNTQEDFKAKGITHVQLRRGTGHAPTKKDGTSLTGGGNTGSILLRPMSSYSPALNTAKGFGTHVHEAWYPVERVIGSALTGFGCLSETEFVVLAGPNEVKVHSSGYM